MAQHTLTARKLQTSRKEVYSQDCSSNIFKCTTPRQCGYTNGTQDPIIGQRGCPRSCPPQNICLMLDFNECAIGNDSKGQDPLVTASWAEEPVHVKCVYDLDKIDRADQLRVYQTKFTDSQYYNTLMGSFCGKNVSKNCADGLNGECSGYLAVTEEGRMCRDWLASLPRDRQDAAMRDYCLKNDTEDCKCINRSTDPDYDRLKTLSNYFSDNCWYRPCSNAQTIYLVPNSLSDSQCATNVCQQIIDANAGGNVVIEGNTNNINCNFKEGDIEPRPNPDDKQPETTSWLDWLTSKGLIIGIAFVLILITLFI